jgi:glycosyltransferase involved in cell wall biosynthesis
MIKKFLIQKYIKEKRFSEAIALSKNYQPKNSHELWIYYKLGFYKTINNTPHFTMRRKELHARIVALSACGKQKEASYLVDIFLSKPKRNKHLHALASSLAPYAPELALKVLEKVSSPSLLKVALLLDIGANDEVLSLLNHPTIKTKRESNLYLSNALNETPEERIKRMNDFLQSYDLSPLQLKDNAHYPSTTNLISNNLRPFKDGPLVTILMTTYNSQAYIKSAIESILNQTYQNIELIVIDDASTDNTKTIIQELAKKDKRIKYIYLPINVGTYVAKSIGLKKSHGEFITCHDSDDWSHPMKIEEQVKPLLRNKSLIFTTSYWVRLQHNGSYYARALHPLLRLNPSSPLFRKKIVLEKAGGWDLVRTGADSEFLARLRLVFGDKAMYKVMKPLTFGAHREDSLMNASSTGHPIRGMSKDRLDYWEAWGYWHIKELRQGKKPYMPLDLLSSRPFHVPKSIKIDKEKIEGLKRLLQI